MIESAMYVIEKTTDPVINYYDQNKKNHRMSDSQLEIVEKLNNNAKNAKAMLSRFKRTGDVYKYLKAIIGTKNDEVATNFRRFGLVPFEDIIDEFEKKFKDNLFETTTIDDFIIEECYTTWDVIFLANNYNQRGYGILSIKNNNNIVEGIVVRGKFDTTENNYANIWINDDELLYHLIGEDHNTNHVNNRELLTGKHPIYVFHTIGPNMQVYRGKFVFTEYLKEHHQVRLIRSNESVKAISVSTVEEYRLPITGKFTKQIEKRDAKRFGTSVINEKKIKSGQKAEQSILNYLNNIGIVTVNVADDPTYGFDIYLPDMEIGLEVKNVSSGSFYISENEMRQIEKEITRLVFVDEENFFVSKPYIETTEMKFIFRTLREIDSFIIENYEGLYSSDDLRIAITEDREPRIKADFISINGLSKDELIELFK